EAALARLRRRRTAQPAEIGAGAGRSSGPVVLPQPVGAPASELAELPAARTNGLAPRSTAPAATLEPDRASDPDRAATPRRLPVTMTLVFQRWRLAVGGLAA